MNNSRREILKLTALGLISLNSMSFAQNFSTDLEKKSNNNSKKKRVVIIGGGWSGLSMAKNLRVLDSEIEVVLIEKNSMFMSCPLSNLWLVDLIELETLIYDYQKAALEHGYQFVNAEVNHVDRKEKVVYVGNNEFQYDYLVVATGIDYDYSLMTGNNKSLEKVVQDLYPAGFIPGSEHLRLKEKIKDFKKGNFILTVPDGNYKCLPAPYERACLIAWYFKENNIPGKVILLDSNPEIRVKKDGFSSAFNELYKDYIEYLPSQKIINININKKYILTDKDKKIYFSDAAFYPRIRGSKLLEKIGIAKDGHYNKLEANIDRYTNQVIGDKYVFCTGDLRSMEMGKTGSTAYSESLAVSQTIANRMNGKKDQKWKSPHTVCYSAVTGDPIKSIYVETEYVFNKEKNIFEYPNAKTMENWKEKSGDIATDSLMAWTKGTLDDILYLKKS